MDPGVLVCQLPLEVDSIRDRGLPVVVVRDGKLLEEMLHIERLTRDEVFDAMREQGIEDLDQVHVGILEADGKFSFITGERHAQQDRRAE